MYAEDMSPIDRKDLDIRQFIALQKNGDSPLVKVRFSLENCKMFYGQNLTEEYQKMDSDGF